MKCNLYWPGYLAHMHWCFALWRRFTLDGGCAATGEGCGFERHEIVVREGKGFKNKVTMLPESAVAAFKGHLVKVKMLHEEDSAAGFGDVYLPFALDKKYPNAGREWVGSMFFRRVSCLYPRSGKTRWHHMDEKGVQRAMKQAVFAAGIAKPATPHTLLRIFYSPGMTFVLCRSCWGILMFLLP